MSILVKGMEMPTTCGKCRIKNAIECDEWKLVRSVALDRHRDCPLIEIPEPHGDLIDRDVTRGSIKPWSPEDERNACTFDTVKKLMYTMLDRAPIIIPASEEVYDKYIDTAGNLHWTGTHSSEHIIKTEEGE